MSATMALSFYKRKFLGSLNLDEVTLEIFRQANVMVTLVLGMELQISGGSSEQVMKAEEILQDLIVEKEFKCKSETYADKEWKLFKGMIKSKHNHLGKRFEIFEVISADEIPGNFKVILAGFKTQVYALEQTVSDFLDDRNIITETLPLNACQLQLFKDFLHYFGFQHTGADVQTHRDLTNIVASIKGSKREAVLAKEIISHAFPLYNSFITKNQQPLSHEDKRDDYCFSLSSRRNLIISTNTPEIKDMLLILRMDTEDSPSCIPFSDADSPEELHIMWNHNIAVTLNRETFLTSDDRCKIKVTATASTCSNADNAIYSYKSLETCLETAVYMTLIHAELQKLKTIDIMCHTSELNTMLFSAFINSLVSGIDHFIKDGSPNAFLHTITLSVDNRQTQNNVKDIFLSKTNLTCSLVQKSSHNIFTYQEALKTELVTGFVDDSKADVLVMHVSFKGSAPRVLTATRNERNNDLNIMMKVVSEIVPCYYRNVVEVPVKACTDIVCTCLFAVSLDELEESSEKLHEELQRIILSCLDLCHNSLFRSIVFPLFDLRGYGMSFAQTMEVMLQEIAKFREAKPSTWIKTVQIILPPEYTNSTKIIKELETSHTGEITGIIISDCPFFLSYLNDNHDAAEELCGSFLKCGFILRISQKVHYLTASETMASQTWHLLKKNALATVLSLTRTKYQLYIENNPSLSALLTEDMWKQFQSIRVYKKNIVIGLISEIQELQKALLVTAQGRRQVTKETKLHSVTKYILANRILANDLSDKFPNLVHSVDPDSGLMKLKGCHKDVCLVEQQYTELLKKLISCHVQLSEYKIRFLKSLNPHRFTQEYLSKEFYVVLETEQHVVLSGLSDSKLLRAKEFLDKLICQNVINIEAELQSMSFIEGLKLTILNLKESINQQAPKIDIFIEPGTNAYMNVIIVGFQKEVRNAEDEIKKYLNEFILVEDRIIFDQPTILSVGSAIFELLGETDGNVALDATINPTGLDIVLRGKKQDVERVKASILEDISSVICHSEIMMPGTRRYLAEDGAQILQIVGKCFQCVLQLGTPESSELLMLGRTDHVIKAREALLNILDSFLVTEKVSTYLPSFKPNIDQMQQMYFVQIETDSNSITVTGLMKDVEQCCMQILSDLISLLNQNIESLQQKYTEAQEREKWLKTEKVKLEQTKNYLAQQIEDLRQDLETTKLNSSQEVSSLQHHVKDLQARLQKKKDTYKQRESAFIAAIQLCQQASYTDDLRSIHLPVTWTNSAQNKVVVQPGTGEYSKVEANFLATCPHYQIINIERIQNVWLRYAYEIKKKAMKKKNKPDGVNEVTVFHGTSEEACMSINKHGFDRSYAGKHGCCAHSIRVKGTRYGYGVYFARSARQSDIYATSRHDGNSFMYQAVILAGRYKIGHANMMTRPSRSHSDNTDLYDCLVDNDRLPSVYAIFHDDQAYPEYLITFRRVTG
ncbi:uncharacterized protein LOC122790525 [Protopterus annectens]|uniref:uncharacterized protein LOC122790525 n=1 Tax=Protopterus annectens TaxID=7888 RepID=UPI001CFC43DC|nr:uncharacterized protein LOC122790525 [Protopterus annectens]